MGKISNPYRLAHYLVELAEKSLDVSRIFGAQRIRRHN